LTTIPTWAYFVTRKRSSVVLPVRARKVSWVKRGARGDADREARGRGDRRPGDEPVVAETGVAIATQKEDRCRSCTARKYGRHEQG
jgi:hypothetical protein